MEEPRLGIRAAAAHLGVNCVPIYVAAARRVLPSEVSPGGQLTFKAAELDAWKTEETLRKVRRDREKTEAAERLRQLMAQRRAARAS